MKRLLVSVGAIVALVASTSAFAASDATSGVRLVNVTSPVRRNAHATLVAKVAPAHRCNISVYYKSGPSHAQGLTPKSPAPGGAGRISWTWKVGGNTTLGRWPITVTCGNSGDFRTYFRVIR
jgi:hypothetical protein